MTVVDVLGAQFCRSLQSSQGVFDVVVLLKTGLEPLENVHCLLDSGFHHVHLLEATRQSSVFFKNTPVFSEGGGPDAFEMTTRQCGLQQIGGIQRATRSRTGTDQGVNFINEQHRMGFVFQRLEHALQTLLEISTVLGARQQGTHVKRVDIGFRQNIGHRALRDAPGQAFSDGGFTYTGLAHQQGVVFAAAAQNLDHPLHFVVAANQGVDFSILGQLVQVLGELLQWRCFFGLF